MYDTFLCKKNRRKRNLKYKEKGLYINVYRTDISNSGMMGVTP